MGQIYEKSVQQKKRKGSGSGKVFWFKLAPNAHYSVISGQTCRLTYIIQCKRWNGLHHFHYGNLGKHILSHIHVHTSSQSITFLTIYRFLHIILFQRSYCTTPYPESPCTHFFARTRRSMIKTWQVAVERSGALVPGKGAVIVYLLWASQQSLSPHCVSYCTGVSCWHGQRRMHKDTQTRILSNI